MTATITRLSFVESVGVLAKAGGPLIAKGVILRRPLILRWLQATGLEQGGIRMLQRVRARHGDGPAVMTLGFRRQAVLLAPADVRRLLEETPDPFTPDTTEKHAALAHFEPGGSLISRGPARDGRRALNEAALESGCPRHSLADPLERIVAEEVAPLGQAPTLSFAKFRAAWFRIARRAVFGDDARYDDPLTEDLAHLRADANWAFLKSKRESVRARFLSRIASYLHRPAADSICARLVQLARPGSRPEDQIGQWLFAFDAAGIATFRALLLLAADANAARRARDDRSPERSFLRACVLDAVRLWPTTPLILRQSTRATVWRGATLPAETGFAIHVPFLCRDAERLRFADRFSPDIWLDGTAERSALVPFSAGPAECPAKNLVLMLASATLATLLAADPVLPPRLVLDPQHLPPTLDPFSSSVGFRKRPAIA